MALCELITLELHALLRDLVAIGAPTFNEARRADFVESWLRHNTRARVGRDELNNVWADLSNAASDAVWLLDAHIDTVFPFETVAIREDGDIWHAPGIADNTATVALLMLWLKHNSGAGAQPILASFTVGEENEGNLRGIKAVAATFAPRLKGACVLDMRLNVGVRQGVGSRRFHLEWSGEGGHAWGDFGKPSAIHAMASWIVDLGAAFPWQPQLHGYNVGVVEGGAGATSIAQSASLKLDVRSIEAPFLDEFRVWLDGQIAASSDGAKMTIVAESARPAGGIAADHPLARMLTEIHQEMELPLNWSISSTNGNALYAAGVPVVTTGLSVGDGIHTPAEWLDVSSLEVGWGKLTRIGERLRALD